MYPSIKIYCKPIVAFPENARAREGPNIVFVSATNVVISNWLYTFIQMLFSASVMKNQRPVTPKVV